MANTLDNLADTAEIAHYEDQLQRYLNLDIDADRFTAIRLQMGVYGQRQEGVNMIRVKLPGGRLDPDKLDAVADVLEQQAQTESAHITTRQDIQIHYVPLAASATALRRLGQAGLTTREACGNTVRNITACPLAGVCPREHTDVTTHLQGAVDHFLRNPLNQQLPRKFKISFSGCESDCAQGMFHDLAIVAVRRGDHSGFKLLAGGGLGHKPHEAITVAEFLEERDLLPAMEAALTLHNKYSDRAQRSKSRIKFLVDRFGADGFIERFNEEFARTRAALADTPHPQGTWTTGTKGAIPGPGAPRIFFAQKQPGLQVLPVSVPLGQLKVAQFRGIAALLRTSGLSDVRTTQDQNLMILGVPQAQLAQLAARIAELGLNVPRAGDNVVACPGASTCRLGITSSQGLAPKLSGGAHDLRIRVSGCHNGCAQPEAGDIGIYGEGRRMHGKLIPHYQTYFGGNGMGDGKLALKGPSIPSARIEQAIKRVSQAFEDERVDGERFVAWAQRVGAERFDALLRDLTQVSRFEVEKLMRDHGDSADFRVVPLGGGECGAATDVAIGRSFFDAAHERGYREAFVFQRKPADAVACAEAQLKLVGEGLVTFLGGAKAQDAAAIATVLPTLADAAELGGRFATLNGALTTAAQIDEAGAKRIFAAVDEWIRDAGALCLARDPQLDLHGALPAAPIPIQFVRKAELAAA